MLDFGTKSLVLGLPAVRCYFSIKFRIRKCHDPERNKKKIVREIIDQETKKVVQTF
jgi:hypothetical protein